MIKRLSMLVLVTLMNNAMAANQVSVAPGEMAVATISAKDPTRLSIKDGRIVRLLGAEGKVTGTPDSEAGDAYITPTASYRHKPFSLFVKGDRGRVVRLLLTPVDSPAEDIELILSQKSESKLAGSIGQGDRSGHYDIAKDWETQHPYEKGIVALIQHMADYSIHAGARELPNGYGVIIIGRRISLWRETEIELWVRFQGVHYVGEIYRIKNTAKEKLTFLEKEFYRSGTLAISLEKMQLAPGQMGFLYIVSANTSTGGKGNE